MWRISWYPSCIKDAGVMPEELGGSGAPAPPGEQLRGLVAAKEMMLSALAHMEDAVESVYLRMRQRERTARSADAVVRLLEQEFAAAERGRARAAGAECPSQGIETHILEDKELHAGLDKPPMTEAATQVALESIAPSDDDRDGERSVVGAVSMMEVDTQLSLGNDALTVVPSEKDGFEFDLKKPDDRVNEINAAIKMILGTVDPDGRYEWYKNRADNEVEEFPNRDKDMQVNLSPGESEDFDAAYEDDVFKSMDLDTKDKSDEDDHNTLQNKEYKLKGILKRYNANKGVQVTEKPRRHLDFVVHREKNKQVVNSRDRKARKSYKRIFDPKLLSQEQVSQHLLAQRQRLLKEAFPTPEKSSGIVWGGRPSLCATPPAPPAHSTPSLLGKVHAAAPRHGASGPRPRRPSGRLSPARGCASAKLVTLGRDLLLAAQEGRTKDARHLLKQGANVNFRSKRKLTPLHLASMKAHSPVVSLLLERGANLNAKTAYGLTPLHMAAYNDSSGDCVSLLIYNGCELDSSSESKRTPLHLAAECGNEAAVRALLAAGAKKTVQNNEGLTPYDMAKTPCVRRLLSPGSERE